MLSLSCTQERHGDVTLVGVVLSATDSTPRRGRLAVTLDGPVWPPRRRGVPEAGWDGDQFEVVVDAGEEVAVGFASPAPPVEPPVELRSDERASADAVSTADGMASLDDDASPGDLVRTLADARPPRDAVPVPLPAGNSEASDDGPNDTLTEAALPATSIPPADTDRKNPEAPRSPVEPATEPSGVTGWLADIEERTADAATVADATRLPAAARAIENAGGLAGVESLNRSLRSDAKALRSIAERATALAEDCEHAADELPLDSLRRLA